MKLLMLPKPNEIGANSGVGQVIRNYHKYLPKVGIEVVTDQKAKYDISSSHLGRFVDAEIQFNHGLWFNTISNQMAQQNAQIIEGLRRAKAIVVPSNYVAETIKRDMRINPFVVPHGVNIDEWKGSKPKGYILWNKNRPGDVCSPDAVYELAARNPKVKFVTTFYPQDKKQLDNVQITGKLPFDKMRELIKCASIYLSTAKETFNISALENLACGTPVLSWSFGGTADLITHKENGYLVNKGDYDELSNGLQWLLDNRKQLTKTCKNTASRYNWMNTARKIKEVCLYAIEKV